MRAHLLTAIAGVAAISLLVSAATAAVVYDAGADLLANEQPDNANEVLNPNNTVPEWSYGFRGTTLGTNLTLFTAADHVNNDTVVLDGFRHTASLCCGGLPTVLVNTGPAAGFPDGLVATGEITMHPDGTGSFPNAIEEKSVVRFTAATAGTYLLSALWEDIDDCCSVPATGVGVDVHVVLNGVSLFDDFISREADALPTATAYTTAIVLGVGDLLDFVVGSNGLVFGDNTRFNATLQLVPEPSTFLLLGAGLTGLLLHRRRRARATNG